MSNDRWVRISVEYFTDEMFASEVFTEREAYQWLIINAAWKETTHRVGSTVYPVPRGGQFRTIRELCKSWSWGNTKVRNFLTFLIEQHKIKTTNNTNKTFISLCNYCKYQDVDYDGNTQTTQEQHTDNTAATQRQHTKGTNTPLYQSSSLHSEDNNSPSPKPLKNPSIKKSAIPENWEPDQGCIDKAYAVGMDRNTLQVEAENFRNHHFNKQSKMVKWEMAFGTWCNNWKKFNANSKPSNVTRAPFGKTAPMKNGDLHQSIIEKLREAGQ